MEGMRTHTGMGLVDCFPLIIVLGARVPIGHSMYPFAEMPSVERKLRGDEQEERVPDPSLMLPSAMRESDITRWQRNLVGKTR